VGPTDGLVALEDRITSASAGIRTSDHQARSLVAIPTPYKSVPIQPSRYDSMLHILRHTALAQNKDAGAKACKIAGRCSHKVVVRTVRYSWQPPNSAMCLV